MKKYYIEINGEQSTPMSLSELESQNITKETLIWFDGLDDWTKAGSILEIESLFKGSPPPIKRVAPPILPNSNAHVLQEEKPSFFSTTFGKLALGGFALAACLLLIVSFSDDSDAQMQNQTQENTELIQQQQQLLEEQNAKIAEQEQIEKERAEREAKEARQKRINELNERLVIENQNLQVAKRQLNDATAFQLLRSSRERNRDINAAEENLRIVEGNIEVLERELKRLN